MRISKEVAIHWDRRWANDPGRDNPSRFVEGAADYFPPPPARVVDIAGGTGRHSVWLAELGNEVTLVDISQVALGIAQSRASDRGVEVMTVWRDLEADGLLPGEWDMVLIHYYLDRNLLIATKKALAPGGLLVFCQPMELNRDACDATNSHFVLVWGELAEITAELDLEVLVQEVGWSESGRPEFRLIARRASCQ